MQLLANENFPLDVVEAWRDDGHDVAWIRTDAPGSKDADFLARAGAKNRILVKDFGTWRFSLACRRHAAHYRIPDGPLDSRLRSSSYHRCDITRLEAGVDVDDDDVGGAGVEHR